MAHKKNSPYPTICKETGFILVFVLMILAVILGLTMAAASITLYHMKSSNAFYRIIKNQLFASVDGAAPASSNTMLGASEGWDHINFSTKVTCYATGTMQSYSWRVSMREPFHDIHAGMIQTSQRPHIIIIIDDSTNMTTSCGQDFQSEALYARFPSGGIEHLSDACEVTGSITNDGFTYFKGSWGNSYLRAPDSGGLSGAMPMWTKHISFLRELLESLDLCEVSLMSTSAGMILPFTMDWRKISRGLDALHPSSDSCPLSEALYKATSLFPSQCISNRHIILVTAGIPVNDGHLPSWLMDFDHDGNIRDASFEKEGSHCLDDVSSYARSLGISVHVIGPAMDFMKDVAAKGGGTISPGREALAPEGAIVSSAAALFGGSNLILNNLRARLDPPWLKADKCRSYRQSVMDTLSIIELPVLSITGIANDSATDETELYCTTSRNQILRITMGTGSLAWLMKGIGGDVRLRRGKIIAGPNSSGMITCMDGLPRILWQSMGACLDASDTMVYMSNGSTIHACGIDNGIGFDQSDTTHTITSVRYDPCNGYVFAGTNDGMVFIFTSKLEPSSIISTGTRDAILDIRPYSLRKELYFIAATTGRLECHKLDGPAWSVSLNGALPTCITVMNGKIVVSSWSGDLPCSGIDGGISKVEEYDALTGDQISTETMFKGRAFGPSIDLKKGVLKFISPAGSLYEKDISGMPGIQPLPLGRRLLSYNQ